MVDFLEKEGPSQEEAVMAGAMALGISEKEAQVQLLSQGRSGRVRVRVGRPGVVMPPVEAVVQQEETQTRYEKPVERERPPRSGPPPAPPSPAEIESLRL